MPAPDPEAARNRLLIIGSPAITTDRTGHGRRRVDDRGRGPQPRVGWSFITLYALALTSTSLLFLAPVLVTLPLKLTSLVGLDRAPESLALVAGVGALVSMVANPFFGRMSDRTTSRFGMRRPWMVIGLVGGICGVMVVAAAPNVLVVLAGWCIAQVFLNALLASAIAVLADQVPSEQRGLVAGVLGINVPIASVVGTFLVQLVGGRAVLAFALPCAVAAAFVLLFVVRLQDRRLTAAERPRWSWRELGGTFWVDLRANPDFGWAFASRFLFILAFAFLTTYQAYYLLSHLGSAEADVPRQVFLGTVAQAAVVVVASVVGGRLSDRSGHRKRFVLGAAIVYGTAMFVMAAAAGFDTFLIGMAISGLGFGIYMAVDLALVVDVIPVQSSAGKDLGVMNIAGALPSSIAPAVAPVVLAFSGGSYAVLYAVAGVCAVLAGLAILPVRRVR